MANGSVEAGVKPRGGCSDSPEKILPERCDPILREIHRADIIFPTRKDSAFIFSCPGRPMSDSDDDIFLPSGQLRPDAVDDATAQALDEALCFTRATNWDSVRTPHLFMGMLAA